MSTSSLDIEQFMFKLAMKSNACTTMVKSIDGNPLTHLWHTLSTSRLFVYSFPKYFKLARIIMVQVISSIKNEQCFISLAFYNFKLCNQLTTNLELVVKMFSQKFYILQNFPYVQAFKQWWAKRLQYGVGVLGFHFNSLFMQKLEVGTILGFWQPCKLQFAKVCWFFLYGSW